MAGNYSRTVRGVVLTLVAGSGLIYGLSPQPQPYHVYYGLMHAHTMISDGSGTPEEAYKMAKDNGLDFFAVTPHNHDQAESGAKERRDGVLIATNPALYSGGAVQTVTRTWKEEGQTHTEQVQVKPLIQAARDATTAEFVAIYGQEFSTISSGNHMNVFGLDKVITVGNGDFKGLLDLIKHQTNGTIPILQLNHPDVHMDLFYKGPIETTKRKMFNDYGVDKDDLGPGFKDLSESLNPYACLLEVLSGPAMEEQRIEHYHYDTNENDYYFYLKEGLRVSPSAGQDNHYRTWGMVTDARMGVVAEQLTRESLVNAIRNRRTFSTEDKNLQVLFYINNELMGSTIKATEESELKLNVIVKDEDEPNSQYHIIVYGGEITPESSGNATEWRVKDGEMDELAFSGDGTFTINGIFAREKPWFYYIKLVQQDGDRLWTAPVWVNAPDSFVSTNTAGAISGEVYYWSTSSSSKVYHRQGCSTISRIKVENLASGSAPPVGRTLHDCHIELAAEP